MLRLAARAMHMVRGTPLSILMYHGVVEEPLDVPDWCFISANQFKKQMSWLASCSVDVMPLHDAVDAMMAGRLSKPTVAITFDDGYRNNVETALPVLERHKFSATIFLATGTINSSRALWPSRLNIAISHTDLHTFFWQGIKLDITDDRARTVALRRLKERIKEVAGADPERAVTEIEGKLGVPENPLIPRGSPYSMMDDSDIERAKSSGLIDFGAHSITHPIVSRLDDSSLTTEISGSIREVKALVGEVPLSFAYPNGDRTDYDERAMQRLKACGIKIALSTMTGTNRKGTDCLQLRRFGVGPDRKHYRFLADVYGTPMSTLARKLKRNS